MRASAAPGRWGRAFVVTAAACFAVGAGPAFASAPAPTSTGLATTAESQTGGTLMAGIDPNGLDTQVQFEYGATTSYGTTTATQDIGSGTTSQSVNASAAGLRAGATYHWRVVATNSAGTYTSPDQTFQAQNCPNEQYRTGLGATLPDCRGYELVTPADKGATYDTFTATGTGPGDAEVSDDGSRVLLGDILAKFPEDPNPNAVLAYDLFTRSSSGWQIQGIKPSSAPGNAQYQLGSGQTSYADGIWSPDLTHVATALTPDANQLGVGLTWQVGPFGGPYTTLAGPANLPSEGAAPDEFIDATPDFSSVLLASMDHSLAPGASGTVPAAYDVYDYTGGSLHLVNVNTDGSLVSPCGADVSADSNSYIAYTTSDANSISSDGSKVFFESPDPFALRDGATDPSCSVPPQLYMRDVPTGTTVEVSAPQGITDPDGPQPAQWVGASSDGSKVFFLSQGELTPDDAGIHDWELYEYDTNAGTLTRVSRGGSGTADASPIQPVVSSDGSTVYFESPVQLTANAPATLPSGYSENLYRYDTSKGTTTYVATAAISEDGDGLYTTPDGKFLLFGVLAQGRPVVLGGPAGAAGKQVYRYDASDGSVICVSCRPDGTASDGPSFMTPEASIVGTDNSSFNQFGNVANPISEDGDYVFFNSNDELVPQDINGTGASTPEDWQDVYEWEADGTGGCSTSDGCVHLLSSGNSTQRSEFLGASADGSNAFIATHSQLVPQDTDQLGDIYDVRIDGGFASPASPPGCSGDGCQGPLSGSPSLPTAATVTFAGPGDASAGASVERASVVSHAVRGSAFVVKVRVPGRGRITISGAGIRRVSRSVSSAGTYRLKVTLTAAMKRRLASRHRLRLRLGVSFAPPGAAAETVRVQLAVQRAVSHHARRTR